MKTTQKVKRVQLEVYREIKSKLIGIVSAEPDYRLSLALNRKLKIGLRHVTPLTVSNGTGGGMAFSRFSYSTEYHDVTFELVSNRQGKDFLLKSFKNVDYILSVNDPEDETRVEQVIKNLRETESITAVFSININEIKDRNLQLLTR
jgi:hypothetical protein